jgi:hypothetical protein
MVMIVSGSAFILKASITEVLTWNLACSLTNTLSEAVYECGHLPLGSIDMIDTHDDPFMTKQQKKVRKARRQRKLSNGIEGS